MLDKLPCKTETPLSKDDCKIELPVKECSILPSLPKGLTSLPKGLPKEYIEKYELIKLNTKQILGYPWPAIIVAILGLAFLIYALFATNLNSSTRSFSILMIILWTLMWVIILWVLWNDNRNNTAWAIVLVPVVLLIIFFVLVVVMNVDGF